MKPLHFLTVLILFCLLLSGCGTTKYVPVKETEYVRDTVILKADTVRVDVPVEVQVNVVPQLDTLRMETSVAEAEAYLDTLTQTLKGQLKNKKTELKKEIQTIEKTKFVERKVEVPVEVVKLKYRIPHWVWYSLWLNLLFLLILILWIKIKRF